MQFDMLSANNAISFRSGSLFPQLYISAGLSGVVMEVENSGLIVQVGIWTFQ